MSDALVEQIEARFAELSEQMSDPAVIADRQRLAEVGRAYRQLEPAARLAAEWRRALDDATSAEELLADDGAEDAELRELLASSRERLGELEQEIRFAMVRRDPNDDKNVIVEIQGARGRRRGRAVGRRRVSDAHALRRAPRLRGRAARGR